jgi:hypothetical protein
VRSSCTKIHDLPARSHSSHVHFLMRAGAEQQLVKRGILTRAPACKQHECPAFSHTQLPCGLFQEAGKGKGDGILQ